MTRQQVHHYIYLGCLLMLAIAIPLSNYVMSMSIIFLFTNWVIEGHWKEKVTKIKESKIAWLTLIFFFVFCFGFIKTDHWDAGLNNLLSKLIFFLGPMIIASSSPINSKELKILFGGFIFSVCFASIYSMIYYLSHTIINIREISVFISHIRFSLCIDMAVVLLMTLALKNDTTKKIRFLSLLISLWLIIYLFIAQTLTGILILFIVAFAALIYHLFTLSPRVHRRIVLTATLVFLCILGSYTTFIIYNYYHIKNKEELSSLASTTPNGNLYEHDFNSIVENGSLTGLYVCKSELRDEWVKCSDVPYNEELEQTLIRYLNSKGLHKDAEGMHQLTDKDIFNIENKIANIAYTQHFGIKRALYPILFSFSLYQQYGIINQSSILQRFELWKTSWHIIKQHVFFGIGVGDNKIEIDRQLIEDHSPLAYEKHYGSHNQFLTIWLMSGIFVLIFFIFIILYPLFEQKTKKSFLYIAFFIILTTSMFWEDTLETQAGISLYAFFNTLLLCNPKSGSETKASIPQ